MQTTEPDRPGNQGAQLLATAIKARGISVNEAGRMIGAPSGYVSRLLSGERKPGRRLAAPLQTTFGIPSDAWDQALPGDDDDDTNTADKGAA